MRLVLYIQREWLITIEKMVIISKYKNNIKFEIANVKMRTIEREE